MKKIGLPLWMIAVLIFFFFSLQFAHRREQVRWWKRGKGTHARHREDPLPRQCKKFCLDLRFPRSRPSKGLSERWQGEDTETEKRQKRIKARLSGHTHQGQPRLHPMDEPWDAVQRVPQLSHPRREFILRQWLGAVLRGINSLTLPSCPLSYSQEKKKKKSQVEGCRCGQSVDFSKSR